MQLQRLQRHRDKGGNCRLSQPLMRTVVKLRVLNCSNEDFKLFNPDFSFTPCTQVEGTRQRVHLGIIHYTEPLRLHPEIRPAYVSALCLWFSSPHTKNTEGKLSRAFPAAHGQLKFLSLGA